MHTKLLDCNIYQLASNYTNLNALLETIIVNIVGSFRNGTDSHLIPKYISLVNFNHVLTFLAHCFRQSPVCSLHGEARPHTLADHHPPRPPPLPLKKKHSQYQFCFLAFKIKRMLITVLEYILI